jgi:hypothetical protein
MLKISIGAGAFGAEATSTAPQQRNTRIYLIIFLKELFLLKMSNLRIITVCTILFEELQYRIFC